MRRESGKRLRRPAWRRGAARFWSASRWRRLTCGFSLVELLASMAILTVVMSALFSFIYQSQKKNQANAVISESNDSARAGLEVMSQEVGQAGNNPTFSPNKTSSTSITASAAAQCITLNNISQISPGDWVAADTGGDYEIVQVLATSNSTSSPSPPCQSGVATPWIQAVFQLDHCQTGVGGCTTPSPGWPFPIQSYKAPYPSGILQGTGTSSDNTLELFGDINADGKVVYVVYSLHAPTGAPTVTIGGTTYTLFSLERSVTPVTFASGATNSSASPLVENVLYNLASKQGPTGQPIFSYPVTVNVSVVPNTVTVVGTVVVNVSVAVNPQALETGIVQYYNMATQIRPLNLAAAVAFSNAGGSGFLPMLPQGLPMVNPSNYYP